MGMAFATTLSMSDESQTFTTICKHKVKGTMRSMRCKPTKPTHYANNTEQSHTCLSFEITFLHTAQDQSAISQAANEKNPTLIQDGNDQTPALSQALSWATTFPHAH